MRFFRTFEAVKLTLLFLLVYCTRALIVLDIVLWVAFTFMDEWRGQVLAFLGMTALLAFKLGLRLGEAAEDDLA
jgi:hypothetical protein